MACPICSKPMEKYGSYEFTIKFLINIYEYYKTNLIKLSNDEQRLTEQELKIYQVFNFTNKHNRDIQEVLLNDSKDQEEAKLTRGTHF